MKEPCSSGDGSTPMCTFFVFVCLRFVVPIKLSLSQPKSLLAVTDLIFSLSPQVREWVSSWWGFGCWQELNHHTYTQKGKPWELSQEKLWYGMVMNKNERGRRKERGRGRELISIIYNIYIFYIWHFIFILLFRFRFRLIYHQYRTPGSSP